MGWWIVYIKPIIMIEIGTTSGYCNKMVATKEFLRSRNVPENLSIPVYSEDYINESKSPT